MAVDNSRDDIFHDQPGGGDFGSEFLCSPHWPLFGDLWSDWGLLCVDGLDLFFQPDPAGWRGDKCGPRKAAVLERKPLSAAEIRLRNAMVPLFKPPLSAKRKPIIGLAILPILLVVLLALASAVARAQTTPAIN